MSLFKPASKPQSYLRLALAGVSGGGKTYTALAIATSLCKRVAVIDTERGSASKYADLFKFDTLDMSEMGDFAPANYVKAINAAVAEGYDGIVIDSLSHAWIGRGGALEMHDNATARSKSGNSFMAWREVTPDHWMLVDAMLQAKAHVIATMRSKSEYVEEAGENGKAKGYRKVGLQSQQREGMEYEFDLVGDMNGAQLVVTKSRISKLSDAVIKRPGADNIVPILRAWLTDGAAIPDLPKNPTPTTTTTTGSKPSAPLGERGKALAALAEVCTQSVELAHKLAALKTAEGADAADGLDENIKRAREVYGDKAQTVAALDRVTESMKGHNLQAADFLNRADEARGQAAADELALTDEQVAA